MGKSLYNILLVENDREIIKNLTEFLNNEGFNVESVLFRMLMSICKT